jgi:hypothetical protein
MQTAIPAGARGAPTPARTAAQGRAAITTPAAGAQRSARNVPTTRAGVARSAAAPATAASITAMGAGYRACRETFFNCMDELCANKDAQLRRCACSSRVREFDDTRRRLDDFTGQMQDFNVNMLTIAMDREDAEAIVRATEGEQAFHRTQDRSESQRILDEIMGRLRSTNEEESLTRGLAAINLSMDVTDAFDSVNMMFGSNIPALEGEALYRAALPICREMAAEVCAPEDIQTVISAYQMAIEQDCNAVHNTLAGLTDRARERVFESGALLDMARLQNFQTRNADDILTCRRKMMEMLSDAAVCGRNLDKCLDWSGRYVDPLTGDPILTENLYRLGEMITRPTGGQTWARTPGNDRFVTFLNSKRRFIEPAMRQCEQIADQAWNAFMEDALAQIRIQQGRKLEEMRQACTGVTAQCLTDTIRSFRDFDARAMSIFGIHSDRTANAICAEVQTACRALMTAPPMDMEWADHEAGEGWDTGMTLIATQRTFEQIMQTCTQVGRNCIIQNCSNLTGQFGLCGFNEDQPQLNRQRLNIISRNLCWRDVLTCVADAGDTAIDRIIEARLFAPLSTGSTDPRSNCRSADASKNRLNDNRTASANTCLIAERIWGNCDGDPDFGFKGNWAMIRTDFPADHQSLMAWLAQNTNSNICFGSICIPGQGVPQWVPESLRILGGCGQEDDITSDGAWCPEPPIDDAPKWHGAPFNVVETPPPAWTNCCETGQFDSFGNCCSYGNVAACVNTNIRFNTVPNADGMLFFPLRPVSYSSCGPICQRTNGSEPDSEQPNGNCSTRVCMPSGAGAQLVARYNRTPEEKGVPVHETIYLFCLGTMRRRASSTDTTCPSTGPTNLSEIDFDEGGLACCDGHFMEVNARTGMYSMPTNNYTRTGDPIEIASYYYSANRTLCSMRFNPGGQWTWLPDSSPLCRNDFLPPFKSLETNLSISISMPE